MGRWWHHYHIEDAIRTAGGWIGPVVERRCWLVGYETAWGGRVVSADDWYIVYRSEIKDPVDVSRECRCYNRRPVPERPELRRALRRMRERVVRLDDVGVTLRESYR